MIGGWIVNAMRAAQTAAMTTKICALERSLVFP